MSGQKILRIAVVVLLAAACIFVLRFYTGSKETTEALQSARERIDSALTLAGDYEEALRLSLEALEAFPEDWLLHFYQGRAYHGRGRYRDAIASLSRAAERTDDPEQQAEIEFFIARARSGRFLDTHDREDFNLAAGVLRRSAEDARHPAAARLLLGMMLAEPTPQQDRVEALLLLEAGLADGAEAGELADVERAGRVVRELRAAPGR
ncbi:MAG: tetratricopeptide repeat protein [Planctomycetes bacterium]|nr:tetratricopeptide repeat protein [Planctomycetota bacterium]